MAGWARSPFMDSSSAMAWCASRFRGYLRDHHGVVNSATRTIPWIAFVAMVFALVANLYPVPEGAYGKLPYIYLAYLAGVLLFFAFRSRTKVPCKRNPERRSVFVTSCLFSFSRCS